MKLILKSRETKFWQWFKDNEDNLYNFDSSQKRILKELSYHLSKVDKNLTFELGPILDNGRREFIISADGIRKTFPIVEKLFSSAPQFDKWNIIKFRPRRNPINDLKINDKDIKADDVYYLFLKDDDPNRIGILLFMKDYKKEEDFMWGQLGYLFLDEALGEYDVETKVGAIVFESIDSEYFKDAYPLKDMTRNFDLIFDGTSGVDIN